MADASQFDVVKCEAESDVALENFPRSLQRSLSEGTVRHASRELKSGPSAPFILSAPRRRKDSFEITCTVAAKDSDVQEDDSLKGRHALLSLLAGVDVDEFPTEAREFILKIDADSVRRVIENHLNPNLLADYLERALPPAVSENRRSFGRRINKWVKNFQANTGKLTDKIHDELQSQILQGIEQLSSDGLEKFVRDGLVIIQELERSFATCSDPCLEEWRSRLQTLKQKSIPKPTIIGVVGNTGGGKSSVINAVLDEEQLMPTNCMRACTAVATEISYNPDPEFAYKASVVFISEEEWRRELEVLIGDLVDADGTLGKSHKTVDSEAGVALAKIKAVYPNINTEDLPNYDLDDLLAFDNSKVLGRTWNYRERNVEVFYEKLQAVIDSKDRVLRRSLEGSVREKGEKHHEWWPLIKRVDLKIHCDILKSGVTLVDLPGGHDANAARARVAEDYLKSCSGLWIVAPINRAIDDKAAKTMLGDAFRRQLMFDGAVRSVTFICTKTDDISINEACRGLELESELKSHRLQQDSWNAELEKLQHNLELKKKEKRDCDDSANDLHDQIDDYEFQLEEHRLRLGNNSSAIDPSIGVKREHSVMCLSSENEKMPDPPDQATPRDAEETEAAAVSGSDIQSLEEKLAPLKKQERAARAKRNGISKILVDIRSKMAEIESQSATAEETLFSLCIQRRNEYAKSAIRSDYASGVREMDDASAEADASENIDARIEQRDYAQLAMALPVFCVSSKAYQKMNGRFLNESVTAGFSDLENTEVPQLKAHGKNHAITKTRDVTYKTFLNDLSRLLDSMALWTTNNVRCTLSDSERQIERAHFNKRVLELDTVLESTMCDALEKFVLRECDDLLEKLGPAVKLGSLAASSAVQNWGLPVDKTNPSAGGMHPSTFAATCRRQGTFRRSNWNEELLAPMMVAIMTSWERHFVSVDILALINDISTSGNQPFCDFHHDVTARARSHGYGAGVFVLDSHIPRYLQDIAQFSVDLQNTITRRQRDASRTFLPIIADAMTDVYLQCQSDSGTGVTKRRRGYLQNHVEQHKDDMFEKTAKGVETSLDEIFIEVCSLIRKFVRNLMISVKRDYVAALGWQSDTPDIRAFKGHLHPKLLMWILKLERADQEDVQAQ